MKYLLIMITSSFLICGLYGLTYALQPQAWKCFRLGIFLYISSYEVLGINLLETWFNTYAAAIKASPYKNFSKYLAKRLGFLPISSYQP